MADITKGHAFSSGDLVTAAKLNNLVDDASIAGITEAAFATGSHIITSSSSAPSPATAGHVWWDTSGPEADGQGILKVHDGTRWQSVAKNVEQYYTNKSGGVLTYGDLVIFNTGVDRSVTTTTSAGNTLVAGVVASGTDGSGIVADNAEGRVVRSGLVVVTTNDPVERGDYLGASATAKEAYSLGSSPTVGAFGIAVKNTATNKWLVALSGHTVDYIQKSGTDFSLACLEAESAHDALVSSTNADMPIWRDLTYTETLADASVTAQTWTKDLTGLLAGQLLTVYAANVAIRADGDLSPTFPVCINDRPGGYRIVVTGPNFAWDTTLLDTLYSAAIWDVDGSTSYPDIPASSTAGNSANHMNRYLDRIHDQMPSGLSWYGTVEFDNPNSGAIGGFNAFRKMGWGLILKNISGTTFIPTDGDYNMTLQWLDRGRGNNAGCVISDSDEAIFLEEAAGSVLLGTLGYGFETELKAVTR
jgi:hypothetical protein